MPRLTIDNRPVEVTEGTTLLGAARALGIEIPTLCHGEGRPAPASCIVCLVKVHGVDRFLPACATEARHGLRVESETAEVRAARRAALELLLGDHLGDCIAPCEAACPAHLDIPAVLRSIAAGKPMAVRAPCDTCDARCERACRRAAKDHPVAIRLLMLYAAQNAQPDAPLAAPKEREFSVHVGRIDPAEIEAYAADTSPEDRVAPANGTSYTDGEARREAERCLRCDCRARRTCRLRRVAAAYGAHPGRYRGARRTFERRRGPAGVIFEVGKCIACGRCVQITREAGEELGLTFVGRGFDVRVAVPFGEPLEAGLRRVAAEVVAACPTGALAFDDERREN